MPVLDFKEIPEAHIAGPDSDRFELFARDFLSFLGYEVDEHPSRGADGGKDLIVRELRKGISGETAIRWLVSCKHKAHSGKAVGVDEEPSILERAAVKGCAGFIGFYSTLPSSALDGRLTELKSKIETQHFDRERIESELVGSARGLALARRYFPRSISEWQSEHPTPAKLWDEVEEIRCEYCGVDLIEEFRRTGPTRSLLTFWHTEQPDEPLRIDDLYWTCRGHCDRSLSAKLKAEGLTYSGWNDFSDYCIPLYYARTVMTVINNVQQKRLGTKAVDKFKTLLLATFPLVARDLTSSEKERMDFLLRIPPYLGGF